MGLPGEPLGVFGEPLGAAWGVLANPWGPGGSFGRSRGDFRDFPGNYGSLSGSILGSFWVVFFVFFAALFFNWILHGFGVPFGSIFSYFLDDLLVVCKALQKMLQPTKTL